MPVYLSFAVWWLFADSHHFLGRLKQGRQDCATISLGRRQDGTPKISDFQTSYLKLIFWANLSFYKISWNYWMCSEVLTRAWHISTLSWCRDKMFSWKSPSFLSLPNSTTDLPYTWTAKWSPPKKRLNWIRAVWWIYIVFWITYRKCRKKCYYNCRSHCIKM